MSQKLINPQEIEVWYVLPAIRREVALALKKQGLEQKTIAEFLGITEPAVSQYCNKKRGREIKFTDEVKKEIKTSAANIASKKSSTLRETQRILKLPQVREIICQIHKKTKTTTQECKVCKE